MRNRLLLLSTALCLLLTLKGIGQSIPNLIPPSPEASSIVGYGNTNVSYYTGSPSLSIPLYTASSQGFQLPITLNYTGFGGINVESTAPWVGLGWALNAGGVVTRTIHGKPDEGNNGYLIVPAIPDYDVVEYAKYENGTYDAEPDEFRYNINGISGSFFFLKNGDIMAVPRTDIKIKPTISANVITGFTLIDTNGTKYICTAIEQSKSMAGNATPTSVPYKNSAWYLSSVENAQGAELMTLNYYSYSDQKTTIKYPINSLESFVVFTESSHIKYSDNYVNAKRIKRIDFDNGHIEFKPSSYDRLDYINDKYLDQVEIYDGANNLIKEYRFEYTYFDNVTGGVSPMASTSSVNYYGGYYTKDHYKRLKLDKVTEWNNAGTVALPSYEFEYNLDQKLPSRFSFARDHWGYYNGQTGNSNKPEPYNKVIYYNDFNSGNPGPYFAEFGLGNMEPSENHMKAGVLKKVTYPTGGSTSFDMEINRVENDDLPGTKSSQSLFFDPDGSWNTFTVSLSNEPFELVKFLGIFGTVNGIQVDVQVNATSATVFSKSYAGTGPSLQGSIPLSPNTYKIRVTKQNGVPFSSPDGVSLSWKNESSTNNKPVGGLRVKSITDYDGINHAKDITRNFYYNEDGTTGSSSSTGRIANVPQYGYQRVFMETAGGGVIVTKRNDYIRTLRSTYPLMFTNGSPVGYGKVTVMKESGTDKIRSQYFFTTPADVQDFKDGYFKTPLTDEGRAYLAYLGKKVETFPFTKNNDRDFMRGLLTKQVDYAYSGSTYKKIREVENLYGLNIDMPSMTGLGVFPYPYLGGNDAVYNSVEGITFRPGWVNQFKRYRIYTGKVDLYQTVEKNYDFGSETLFNQVITTNYFDRADDGYFARTADQIVDSKGDIYKNTYKYSYDRSTISGLTTTEQNVLDAMAAETKNMIGNVIEQVSFKGATKLSTTRNIFATFNSTQLQPQRIETALGTNSLESRMRYHSYDSRGNPLEVSQEGGSHISYLWGYGGTVPVAQVQNATYSEISSVISQSILDNPSSDTALRTELAKLRNPANLKGVLVTTMTYKPGVGMTSQTSPNGLTMYYEYDDFGRLKYVKDKDGNILKKNEYAYKVNANATNN